MDKLDKKDVFEAVISDDFERAKLLIENCTHLTRAVNSEDKTVALLAAEKCNLPFLKYVLNIDPISLKLADTFGRTVIDQAIEHGALDIVKYIIEDHKWDVHKPNKNRFYNTPIHTAAKEGQLQILKYLLEEKNGDVNVRNEFGDTPLFLAAEKPFFHIVKYLVEERKANVTVLNDFNCNILFQSAKIGDLSVARYLLEEKKNEACFDINWRNDMNYTVVYVAARNNKIDFLKYVVDEKHANISIVDILGRSPLHIAAYGNHFDVCKFLVEHGADFYGKDFYKNTPIMAATRKELIKYLDDARHGRVRRSVFEPRIVHSNEMPDRVMEKLIRKAIGGISSYRINLIGHDDIRHSNVDNFLVVVDLMVRYIRGSCCEYNSDFHVLALQDLLERRMDPIAVESAHTLSDFEDA